MRRKVYTRAETMTAPCAVRQKSTDRNANKFVSEDHMAFRPEMEMACLRAALQAHWRKAVPAEVASNDETRMAKVVPTAEAPAWECTSNDAVVPEVTEWLSREA